MDFDGIRSMVEENFPDHYKGEDRDSTPMAILVESKGICLIMEFLRDHDNLFFDSLSCLTGIDNGQEKNTMEVVYNLYSIPYNHHLMVKTSLSRENPRIDSVSSVWKTANWHEREAYDLLGIRFTNHPDLRRILLPDDWEGHPLRKDYKEQDKYHGINVVYDRDDQMENEELRNQK